MGVGTAEEKAGFSGDSSWRAHKGLRTYADPPPRLQHQGNSWKGTSGTQGESEVTGNRASAGDSFLLGTSPEARQQHCPLSEPSPTRTHKVGKWVVLPSWLPKAPPHNRPRCQDRESERCCLTLGNTHRAAATLRRQRSTAQVREQSKPPEKN